MYIFIIWNKDFSKSRYITVNNFDYAVSRINHYFAFRDMWYYGNIYKFNGEFYELVAEYKKEV